MNCLFLFVYRLFLWHVQGVGMFLRTQSGEARVCCHASASSLMIAVNLPLPFFNYAASTEIKCSLWREYWRAERKKEDMGVLNKKRFCALSQVQLMLFRTATHLTPNK